ncbi:dihydropteroate synthase [Streptosporangium sp. NBC_01755]|uniref:dihydropteroate synthase n=1 Tax=Streptosporangium sp. NBC_01755 TaxID=2975949 RepID=UPI002DD8564E|nr:dihydropteroate synthase [Streptosporangium sp. NBC_01755]WSC97322.1 dihydropteroate synthase [Streptosporangium sp. NBC_01755]
MAAELMGVAQRRGAGFGTRTPDSFYDRGVTFAREQALRRVEEVVAEGADIVDIGGVKAAPGVEVGVAEEIDRTAAFVAEIRERYPDLIISVDTWHSLEVTRRLAELVATGWPVLVSLSNKDFVGESLGLPVDQRMFGTLAVTAICAWQGARIYRAHNVAPTRQVLDMVAVTRGVRVPSRIVRGLA